MEEQEVDETQAQEESGEVVSDGDDSQVGDAVDQRAAELTGSGGASDDAPQAGSDPIAQAEAHLADVDMDGERKKLQELQDNM